MGARSTIPRKRYPVARPLSARVSLRASFLCYPSWTFFSRDEVFAQLGRVDQRSEGTLCTNLVISIMIVVVKIQKKIG
ncbi:hypothetical protein BDM02DRAFT_3112052 [Thelephora ganbajun]|uniref:Uncharacterized protein n=1 Tax=Thelephora ganbajun TaxID=370292 RepID=A0ACB6ZN08_THEGA|nr:hypothetical protein BDM02DRAFT_3112052 [Thelephora ganbajun]